MIAIIAILAAVLIPTFSQIARRADESADTQLLRGLNLALAASSATEKPKTMHDVLRAVAENGYNVDKLTPRTERDILWNSEKNEFLLHDRGAAIENPHLFWKIAKTAEDLDTDLNCYLTFPIGNIAARAGIDAGEQIGTNIVYTATASHTVLFRTNGGTLTVNNPNGSVEHYGSAELVTVTAVSPASYHEYGSVEYLDLIRGGLKIEQSGRVALLDTSHAEEGASLSLGKTDAVGSLLAGEGGAVRLPEDLTAERAKKVTVGTAEEWKALFPAEGEVGNRESDADYILLSADITLDQPIFVGRSVVIDGGGHTITTSASRMLRVNQPNVTLSLKNLTVTGGKKTERGVQVDGGITGAVLRMDRVVLQGITYYGINICNGVGVDITMENSTVTAWGALNLWSADYAVRVYNCTLNGVNDKGYNAAGWNDFATVVLEGDTTGKTTDHSSVIDVSIANSTITATQTTGNKQSLIGFNTGATGNNLKLSGCLFSTDGAEPTAELSEGQYYNSGRGNQIDLNGKILR